jgi:hypothetical protein
MVKGVQEREAPRGEQIQVETRLTQNSALHITILLYLPSPPALPTTRQLSSARKAYTRLERISLGVGFILHRNGLDWRNAFRNERVAVN